MLVQHLQAPAKRSLHLDARYRIVVGRNMLRAFGHSVATCLCMLDIENWTSAHARAQHRCTNLAIEYNIMQHPQMLHEKFDHSQIWTNNTQHVATRWPNARKMLRKTIEILRSFSRSLINNTNATCNTNIVFNLLIPFTTYLFIIVR